MKDITVRIIGRNAKEVGDHLELLTKELLAKLGFGSFVRNVYKTGAEIDLRARHRVTGASLVCECKAKSKPIGTTPIRVFYAEWDKQRQADHRLHGMVISTSGYTGTAKQWYEELNEETRKCFTLIGPEELLSQLVDTGFTLSPQAVSSILAQNYSLGDLHDQQLIYSNHGLAWVCVYEVDGKPRFHTVVNGEARPLPTWKCREITNRLWKKTARTDLFGLDLRRKVQIELLRKEGQSVSALSEGIQESETDVRLALEVLTREGKIREDSSDDGKEQRFQFIRDIVPFVNVARDILNNSQDAVVFLSANYTKEMLESSEVVGYVDSRYHLGMSPNERETLARILSISPSALWYALFGDTEQYVRSGQEIYEKILDPGERQHWAEMHRTSLLQRLVPYAVRDIIGSEYSLSNHLSELGVKRYRIQAGIDAIGVHWKLSAHGMMLLALEKANSSISAGSLVSSTDPVGYIMWDGLLFLETGEYQEAERILLKARDLGNQIGTEKKPQQAILNNLAIALMGQSRWEDALGYLDEALSLGAPEFPELISNKAICIEHLDKPAA